MSGTIDGISYATSQNVYDSLGDGVVTDIIYYKSDGTQVAERGIIGLGAILNPVKTLTADGSFTIKETDPGANGGLAKGYTLETFSSAGIWLREDVYLPIISNPGNPGGSTVTGYTDINYTVVNTLGVGSSGMISGADYDTVLTHYNAHGQITEKDWVTSLVGSYRVVDKQVFNQPNPFLSVYPFAIGTAGTALALNGTSLSDPWAASNPGLLALNISVDSGTLSGTDSAGHSFSVSTGTAAHLSGTLAQINSDLSQLSFSGPTGIAHVTFQVFDQAGVETSQQETITLNPPAGSSATPNPVLSGPATLSVPTDMLVHGLNVAFSDPWATNHAGSLAINVTTSIGTLTDIVAGHSTTGAALHLTGTYSQIEADISGLALTSSQAGTGTIRLEVYDQAGVEAVHVIGVTVEAPAST